MPTTKSRRRIIEFGDFQTPPELAREVCAILARRRIVPASIVEPTCGTGNFLTAALDQFSSVKQVVGLEVDPAYVRSAKKALRSHAHGNRVTVTRGSFFNTDWSGLLQRLPDPLVVIGNPPWVTNSELGALGSSNLPEKSNFHKRRGFDALTGKSNFDISEWMLIRIFDWFLGRDATLAMLCKTAVARKALTHAWENRIPLRHCAIYRINALQHFSASVDACLLVAHSTAARCSYDCAVYEDISSDRASHTIGYRDGQLIGDIALYDQWKHLQGEERYKWRSGIKHDCSKVMELQRKGAGYVNGLGEYAELEDECLFPMLKSSDIANGTVAQPRYFMLVTQRSIGENTASIATRAPKTWQYLQAHADRLDKRASSIYRKRPSFSIFGVGDYSFSPWKVAIAGFYKKLAFKVVGNVDGKPVVLDDTSYFIPCRNRSEAEHLASLLNSLTAHQFYEAFIFWDTKRPITVELLRRLDLLKLAHVLGSEEKFKKHLAKSSATAQLAYG